jgi:MFS family permease
VLGIFFMMVSSLGYGLIVYIENDIAFFIASLGLRLVMGLGDAGTSTSIFSIIGSEFTSRRELFFGYFESMVGLGLMLGPIMGQIIFNAVGFQSTFYVTAGILGVPLLLCIVYVPSRLNTYEYKEAENGIDEKTGVARTSSQQQLYLDGGGQVAKPLTFVTILKNPRAMMASISSIFAMIFMLFTDTIFSNYAISIGVSDQYIGYIFAMPCLVYTICAPMVGILCKYIRKMYLT